MIKEEDLVEALISRGEIRKEYGFAKVEKAQLKHDGRCHGSCCYCQTCLRDYDECVCNHNEWIDIINGISK